MSTCRSHLQAVCLQILGKILYMSGNFNTPLIFIIIIILSPLHDLGTPDNAVVTILLCPLHAYNGERNRNYVCMYKFLYVSMQLLANCW